MATILYVTNGMASSLHSSFELSRRLVEAGHSVIYCSAAPVAEQVVAHGHRFLELARDRRLEERMAEDPRPPLSRPVDRLRWVRRRRELRRESIEDRELETIVERLTPDLLLIDIEMHAAIVATARYGIPTLLPMVFFTVFRRPGLPPLHTDLGPDDGALAIRLAWLRLRFASAYLRLRGWLRPRRWLRPLAWDTTDATDLAALARHRGYDLAGRTDTRQWLRPHVYRDLPVLSFTALEMELPHAAHPSVTYVGPMVHRARDEARLDPASEATWRRFCSARAERERRGEERPLVYASLGSFWPADRGLLDRILETFARRGDWDLVVGLGDTLAPDALAAAPPNACLLRWAPQLEVLQLADAAITHGGATTLSECVTLGVPMVVYSTRHVDQPGCAVRVGHHGLGVVGDPDRDGPDAIAAHVERALVDPEIRRAVESMRDRCLEYERRGDGVRVIEAALRAR